MQQRQLLWLLGALVVLVGLAILSGAFDKSASTMELPAIDIPGEALTHLVVTRDGEPFSFEKRDGTWTVTAPVSGKADSTLVAQLIANLTSIELETIVSNSAERYAEYGLAESAKQVDLAWSGGGKTLLIGNNGPDLQSYYVRIDSDPRVYLAGGRLSLPDDTDRWRDKTVLAIPLGNIEKAVVSAPDSGYELNLTAEGWTVSVDGDAEPADSAAVAAWLARFAPLRATGFLRDVAAVDVKGTASHQIHFSIPGAGTLTLWIEDRETELAAAATGADAAFRLTYNQLPTLIPEANSFVP
jgi:hypothetical protein